MGLRPRADTLDGDGAPFPTAAWADDMQLRAAVYDPVSGPARWRHRRREMWSYDVETDTWTSIARSALGPEQAPRWRRVRLRRLGRPDRRVRVGLCDVALRPRGHWQPGRWRSAVRRLRRARRLRDGGWPRTPRPSSYDEAADRTVIIEWAPDRQPTTRPQTAWEILADVPIGTTWSRSRSPSARDRWDMIASDPVNGRLLGCGEFIESGPAWQQTIGGWISRAATCDPRVDRPARAERRAGRAP